MAKKEVINFFKDAGLRRTTYQLLASKLALSFESMSQFDSMTETLRQALIGEDKFAHFRLISNVEKEGLIGFFREVIGDDRLIGNWLLSSAGRLFDELCDPEEIMPDSPMMRMPEMDTLSAMWASIVDSERQAEMKNKDDPYHHDYAEGTLCCFRCDSSCFR